MAETEPLLQSRGAEEEKPSELEEPANGTSIVANKKAARVASLDVFRGLCVFVMVIAMCKSLVPTFYLLGDAYDYLAEELMTLVDYAGSIFPIIAHAPWNGVHLADFVMPFFLFVAGVSVAIAYKKVSDRVEATWKSLLRALKLFLLGIFLQGGYFHGVTSLTYGVDVEKIRLLGILQRISIGYAVAALCEIWLPCQRWRGDRFLEIILGNEILSLCWTIALQYSFTSKKLLTCVVLLLSVIYLGFLYGLYVPDWQYMVQSDSSLVTANNSFVNTVKCSVRGDLGPACNSAGMIDRYILGFDHLYAKPVYRNLKECNISSQGQVPETSPSWCHAPFDPEDPVYLQFTHSCCDLHYWSPVRPHSTTITGMPLNKSLYTISYLMVTTASAGITFCLLYVLVDVYDWRWLTCVLEWMGKHSLSIFILVTSNIVVITAQGFYLKAPQNNIVSVVIY
ncbi:hypothetical protein DH2020_029638 [Rehmannia glutinosa]|uniref:Heparan-alpha-glucosaminide N-acetyltransferase catalytic domain-containing protein n=1 Tax=Rehmannia glutinosa TaxID=99300 RepID=A0ABR0VQJ2_REHGL